MVKNETLTYLEKQISSEDSELNQHLHSLLTDYKKNQHRLKLIVKQSDKQHKEQILLNLQLNDYKKTLEERIEEGISELRQKDQLLVQQSKMAAMGEMIGVIAHQWKQPLSILSLVTQNLKQAFKVNKLNEEFIDKSVTKSMKQISHMTTTIDDFKNFFSPNKEKELFDVKETINQTLNILEGPLKEHGITASITGENFRITNYKNELQQVMLNIIGNAKDALANKDIEDRKIMINIETNHSDTIINIADNGGGIPADIIETIFYPYFTTKGDKGTGIGLYMVKMIIDDSMNGEISAENIDDGACFSIKLYPSD